MPYLLRVRRRRGSRTLVRSAALPLIADTKTTSGFEADFHRLAQSIALRRRRACRRRFSSARCSRAAATARDWTLLLDQTTLFDLPEASCATRSCVFSPGAYRYVRVTWDDTNSAQVPMPHDRDCAHGRSRRTSRPTAGGSASPSSGARASPARAGTASGSRARICRSWRSS